MNRKFFWAYTVIYIAITYIFFFTNSLIDPASGTCFVLGMLTLLVIILEFKTDLSIMDKYRSWGKRITLGLLSIYSSFASFGYRFFLYGDKRPVFSWEGLIYCSLGAIWFYPLLHSALIILTKIAGKQKQGKERTAKEKWIAFSVIFTVLIICQSVILIAFWPGAFPPDCLDQIRQATRKNPLNDWHSVIHTLFFRIILSIYPNVGVITLAQMLLMILTYTMILMEGYRRGIGLLTLCIGGGLFILLPNQVFSSILTTADYLYTFTLVTGIWLLFRLSTKTEKSYFILYIVLTADLFLMCTIRHNGIIPYIFTCVACIIFAIHQRQIRFKLLLSVFFSAFLILLYKGPLFQIMKVIPNQQSPFTTMFCAVGSCINKELTLSPESYEIMGKIMPIEDWGKYYGRFVGHDNYRWGGGQGMNFEDISIKEALYTYLSALYHHPDVIIKDRLDCTNILWDVTQPRDGFNIKAFDYVYGAYRMEDLIDYTNLSRYDKNYYNRSVISNFYRMTTNTGPNQISDIVLWRSGAYIIIFGVLLIYWHANKHDKLFFSSIPLLGNIAGLLLVLYLQNFRYIYAIQVQVIVLLFFTLIIKKGNHSILR